MTARDWAYGPQGQLRPMHRFFFSLLAIFTAYLSSFLVVPYFPRRWDGFPLPFVLLGNFELYMFVVLLAVFALLTRGVDGKSFGSMGFAFHARWAVEFGQGLALGAAMIAWVAGAEYILGLVKFSVASAARQTGISGGLLLLPLLLMAAANEEMVFRGYSFQRLKDAIGAAGAVVAFSVLFGLIHLGNPSHTWLSMLNTVLVGILLALAYLRTLSLWLPLGIHFAWNFVQGYCFGLPVSGLALPHALVSAQTRGPGWLTGGRYGPEAGLLATVSIAAGMVYVLAAKRIRISQEMRRLVLGAAV